MSKFFIGQRVRIKWSNGWPELNGQEGRVVAITTPRPGIDSPTAGCFVVAPDCWGSPIAPQADRNGYGRFTPMGEQLEPILPEGMQPAKWEDCMWQPNNETKHVDQEVVTHDNQAVRTLD